MRQIFLTFLLKAVYKNKVMSEKRPPGCENCKLPCTIHLTQIVNGMVDKVDMCGNCPHAGQMKDPMEFGLMEKLLGVAMQKGGAKPVPSSHLMCEHCGYPESEFKKTGRMGCAKCYDVFVSHKMELLKKIQDAVLHKGKIPKSKGKQPARMRLAELSKKLQGYIDNEEYEQAALARDEIKTLKEQLEKNA